MLLRRCSPLLALLAAAPSLSAQTVTNVQFVNGLTLNANTLDNSAGSAVDRRFGFFSDLYYDRTRNEWWALPDRGPGGSVLSYETRLNRFTISVDLNTGAISNFRLVETIKLKENGVPLNGLAPSPVGTLGNAFDPEGLVVIPGSGNFLISDEYGPSLYEVDRVGNVVRRFVTPANLLPRDGNGNADFTFDGSSGAGKRNNRGFEGLAISPDGKFAYAMLQSAMNDEGASNGTYARIVKFDIAQGTAVAQYAYPLAAASQGRGSSALVALGNDKFLVLERNNRGVGVGATLASPDKNVFLVDLAGATDISSIAIPGGVLPGIVVPVSKGPKVMDLDANTLAALGGFSPEKWEGLAVGPQLNNGLYLILAGTDNDFSVTQSGLGTQFDVWFDFSATDPYASSIQCPIGVVSGCFLTSNQQTPATVTSAYSMLPGVLHAYTARLTGYQPTVVPEPATVVLTAGGLLLIAAAARRRQA